MRIRKSRDVGKYGNTANLANCAFSKLVYRAVAAHLIPKGL